MKKALVIILLTSVIGSRTPAQQIKANDSLPNYGKMGTFIHRFSVGLPVLNFDWCIPVKNKGLLDLPYGQGAYFYQSRNSLGSCIPATDGNIRFFSLFFDDKWGVELGYAAYGTKVNPDAFQQYLVDHLSNYYITGPKQDINTWFSYYSGLLYGATYMFHYKKYLIAPKLLMGFRSAEISYTDDYSFKERGSNHYLNYSVTRQSLRNFSTSFHTQLNFARQFYWQSQYTKLELGIKLEYMFIPYHTRVVVSRQSFGTSESEQAFDFRGNYQMFSIGVYYAIYIVKKHKIPVKKKL